MTVVQVRPWGAQYARLVAEEVRGIAAKKRITGIQLAEAVGVSQQSMSRRMTGSLPFSIDELAEVARVLQVDVADLLPTQRSAQVTGDYVARVIPFQRRGPVRSARPQPLPSYQVGKAAV